MILLDTNVVLWLADQPEKLSRLALSTVRSERESGVLAVAGRTLWEIAFLVGSKRIEITIPLGRYLREIEERFRVLQMTAAIAEQSVMFSAGFPRNPSDQVIAATAVVHGIPLITSDRLIRESGEVACIW